MFVLIHVVGLWLVHGVYCLFITRFLSVSLYLCVCPWDFPCTSSGPPLLALMAVMDLPHNLLLELFLCLGSSVR